MKHSDPLDVATELAGKYSEIGVAKVRNQMKPEQVQNEDGTWPILECVDCGVDIPEQRLQWGRVRCTDCQENKERRQQLHGI